MRSQVLAACVLLVVLADSTAVAGKSKGRGGSVSAAGAAKGKGKGAGSAGAKGKGAGMTPLAAAANSQRLIMVKWLCTREDRTAPQKMEAAEMFQCKFKDYLSKMKSMNKPEQATQKKALVDNWLAYAKAHRDKQTTDFWKMFDTFCAAKPPPQGADAICSTANALFSKARAQNLTPASYLISTGAAKAGGKGGGKPAAGGAKAGGARSKPKPRPKPVGGP